MYQSEENFFFTKVMFGIDHHKRHVTKNVYVDHIGL